MAEQRTSRWRMTSRRLGIPMITATVLACGVAGDGVWPASVSRGQDTAVAAPGAFPGTLPVQRPVQQRYTVGVVDPATGEVRQEQRVRTVMVTEMPAAPRNAREQELEAEAAKVAAELRSAEDPSQRDELTKRLEQILREAFELQQQRWARQIEQLRSQLEQLERQRNERQERQDAIVQRRLSELTGSVDPLAWEPAVPTATSSYLRRTTATPNTPQFAPASPMTVLRTAPSAEGSARSTTPPGKTAADIGAPAPSDAAAMADRVVQAAGSYLDAGKRLLAYMQQGDQMEHLEGRRKEQAETATEVAKVRFELAKAAFEGLKKQLALSVQAAEQRRTAADAEREQAALLHEQGVTTHAEVSRAQQAEVTAMRDQAQAQLALQAWEQAAQAIDSMVERAEQLSEQLLKAASSTEPADSEEGSEPRSGGNR